MKGGADMKTEHDIKYCMTNGVPNEVLIKAESEKKVKIPSCLTNPERQAELLERYQEE